MVLLSELKSYLAITGTDKDTFLQTCIDSSIEWVQSYCNRKLASGSYTEYTNGNETSDMFLRNSPVNSLTSIAYFDEYDSYDDIFTSPDTIEDTTIIYQDINLIRLTKGYYFPIGFKNIKTVYTAGYSSTTCPDDLKNAIIEIAATIYNNSKQGDHRLGLSAKNVNSATNEGITYKDIIPTVKDTLHKYKLLNI